MCTIHTRAARARFRAQDTARLAETVPDDAVQDRRATRHKRKETP